MCLLHFFFNSVAAHCCCLSAPFHNQPTCRAANRLTQMLHYGQESQSCGTIHFFVSVPLRPSRNALTFFFFAVRRQLLSQITVQVHIHWSVQSVITGVNNKITTPSEEYYNQCQNIYSCVQVIRISASGGLWLFNTLRGLLSRCKSRQVLPLIKCRSESGDKFLPCLLAGIQAKDRESITNNPAISCILLVGWRYTIETDSRMVIRCTCNKYIEQ